MVVAVLAFNASTLETEAGRSPGVQGWSTYGVQVQYRETLPSPPAPHKTNIWTRETVLVINKKGSFAWPLNGRPYLMIWQLKKKKLWNSGTKEVHKKIKSLPASNHFFSSIVPILDLTVFNPLETQVLFSLCFLDQKLLRVSLVSRGISYTQFTCL